MRAVLGFLASSTAALCGYRLARERCWPAVLPECTQIISASDCRPGDLVFFCREPGASLRNAVLRSVLDFPFTHVAVVVERTEAGDDCLMLDIDVGQVGHLCSLRDYVRSNADTLCARVATPASRSLSGRRDRAFYRKFVGAEYDSGVALSWLASSDCSFHVLPEQGPERPQFCSQLALRVLREHFGCFLDKREDRPSPRELFSWCWEAAAAQGPAEEETYIAIVMP